MNSNSLSLFSLKETIANKDSTTEDKNEAFDALKNLNQISSKEELLEEKIKTMIWFILYELGG